MSGSPDRPESLDRRLRSVADDAGFVLLWGWILLSLFFVPTVLGFWWLGVVLSLGSLVLGWQAAAASAYPVTTIGTKRRVDVEPIEEWGRDCDECHRDAARGEVRRYATENVLFGSVVARPESGENVYCSKCADGPDPARSADDRRTNSEISESVSPDDREFDRD